MWDVAGDVQPFFGVNAVAVLPKAGGVSGDSFVVAQAASSQHKVCKISKVAW